MWNLSGLVLLLVAATFVTDLTAANTDTDFSDCASNLGTLEKALFKTGRNMFELNRIFFPPSLRPTRFVRVEYLFLNHENEKTDCNVTYIWAIGEVLFLQPPTLFKLNSLFFYYPNNELTTLHLQLPIECIALINGTDGMCSCMNDSQMLDILTQQLNIFAKFTNQENVERSPTFARAVCAGELHDIYYSGKNEDFVYIIVGITIIGPSLVIAVFLSYARMKLNVSKKKRHKNPKNLVSLVLMGIYTTLYILILDILAVNIVRTSRHEYEPEFSGRSQINVVVTYVTLGIDLLASVFLLLMMSAIIIKYCRKQLCDIECMFPLLLISPCVCIMSHFGYILLAWITEPSRSTTTLVLYYFTFSYLFLVFRKSYVMITKLCKNCTESCVCMSCLFTEDANRLSDNQENNINTANEDTERPVETDGTEASSPGSENTRGQARVDNAYYDEEKINIHVLAFIINIPLGVLYIGVAVLFIMAVYLMPLASEDLFNYLFNVIQFMIVVISTQFAYKLLAGNKFSLKKVIKSIKDELVDREIYKSTHDKSIAKEVGQYIATKILVPHVELENTGTSQD